ncbi:peptidoglycan-recognition protein SB1-like [Macrosteles quadrilineatus]|uniref:peptidoglycan-recognition protein SB1-like n=1 Tax=Macrosteles quadrilineatus TaxID=74068 RepID=UPI0023E2D055|nr:peptidoglycan-recognition protein SB1-like [Macrosteles quadrilineatus]
MPGQEFEDFVAGKKPNYSRKTARKLKIKLEKPIRYDWFKGYKCDFEYIMREDWGAEEPLYVDEYHEIQADVLVNFTNTEECDNVHECIRRLRKMQKDHMDAGEPDIRHNFMVGGDGHIYEGRGWHTKPPYDPKWPDISDCMINIAYIGQRGMFPKKALVMKLINFLEASKHDPGCLQEHIGVYLDYFDEDTPMTDELYNYLHTKEGNELDESELPKEYRKMDKPPWETKGTHWK